MDLNLFELILGGQAVEDLLMSKSLIMRMVLCKEKLFIEKTQKQGK